MIIDPADRLPEPLSPLQQEYKWYCDCEKKAKRKPDPIMKWAELMHIHGNYDPLNPDLIPIPFEDTDFYDELTQ
tara:strand:+ start:276 stop:497 length:222 start_codon:yes stop_codon:yes gene_type:complete